MNELAFHFLWMWLRLTHRTKTANLPSKAQVGKIQNLSGWKFIETPTLLLLLFISADRANM